MPTAAGMLSAGITVTLGSTTLTNVFSTPAMGKEPEKQDVTNFGCTTKKAYIAGLEDVDTLKFGFYPVSTLPADANNVSCTVTYPNGTSHSFTGDVRYYMGEQTAGTPLKAEAAVVVSDWGSTTNSSSNSSGGGG